MNKITLTYEHIPRQEDVRKHIQECEGHHTQQAIYSTFHDALTQICFGCLKVRSTIFKSEPNYPSLRDFRWKVEGILNILSPGSASHRKEQAIYQLVALFNNSILTKEEE